MQIPEALLQGTLWEMPAASISGMYIYCEPGEKKAVYDFFTKKFNEDWDTAVKEVIEENGREDDYEVGSPLIASEFLKTEFLRILMLLISLIKMELIAILMRATMF